jgi:hypothetical protein
MLRNVLTVAIIGALAYWYWTGPYRAGKQPDSDYAEQLKRNDETMRLCIRTMNYRSGATGEATGDPESVCAEQHGVYFDEGHWHRYSDTRPG